MENIPQNFYRVSAKALILNTEGKFLLIQEDNGMWEIPGGGIDFGESYQQTLSREIMEEMGLEVTKIGDRPEFFTVFKNDNGYWAVNVFFKVELKNLDFVPSAECQKLEFFDAKSASQLKSYKSIQALVLNLGHG